VLFVDLVGYTSMTHTWDAADVRDMLLTYFDLARGIVRRYGGEVAKFIGDAVVAVWGSRATREDDAERCVGAGLDIVEAVARIGEQGGLWELTARGGVVTGRVALLDGADEGLVAGDIVNIASRIQSAADPGSVLVDDVTMRATRATLAYASAGEHLLKGVPEPMQLWRAVRVLGRGSDVPLQGGLSTSFVGRDHELAALKTAFQAMLGSRLAGLVSITGPAGIGKTRLASEFESYVARLVPRVASHRGRCPSYGEGVAFHALSEIVRHRLSLKEEGGGESAQATLTERLAQWVPDEAERAFVEPRLSILIGHSDRDFPQQELFAAWRLFLERLSDAQPVVLLFEDLQWADSGLLDFLSYLLEWSAAKPLFFLTLARVSSDQEDESSVTDHPQASRVHLDPLPADVIQHILDGLVPGMPQALKAKIINQAAGVPLYAVETVGSLIDRGLVVKHHDRLTVLGDVQDLDVPASLTALIAARLDQLPADERDLIKALAILGSSFARHAIAAVAPGPEPEIDRRLDALVGKGILAVTPEQTAPGAEQYRFVQSILATVAFNLLSRRERKARHLAVATRLEDLQNSATEVELVAAHYHDAYRASAKDPDRNDIRARTAAACERAAERVGSLGLPGRAREYYTRAASLTENEIDRLQFIASAARMSFLSGRYEDSLELYEEAIEGHHAAKRDVAEARLVPALARTLSVLGRIAEGLSVLQNALDALAEHQEVDAQAEAHAVLAEWYAFSLSDKEVAQHAERALELATAANSPEVLSKALNAKGWLLQRQHRAREAADTFQALVDVARKNDLAKAELMGRGNLADVRAQADLPGAEAEHLAALELTERLGDVGNRAIALSNLAFHYFYAGQWERTESYGRRAVHSAEITELQNFGHFPLLMLAVAREDAQTARSHLIPLQRWATDDDPQSRDSYLIAEAGVAFIDGSPEEAIKLSAAAARSSYESNGLMSESFRLAWPLSLEAAIRGSDLDEARALLDTVANAPSVHVPPYLAAQRARYAALIDIASEVNTSSIEPDLRFSLDSFRSLGYGYWLARTKADLALWLESQRRSQEARQLFGEARDMFIQLGAKAELAKQSL